MSCKAQFKKVTHVIFDMDGILLDTEPLNTKAVNNIVSKYGKVYDWSAKCHVLGLIGADAAEKIVELLNLPISAEEFYELAKIEYGIIMKETQIMPGAAKLVKHLHKHKVPIAVATSSSQEGFDLKSANHKDFFALFNHIVCGGSDPEVKEGKPKPDVFLVCASRFPDKPHPHQCLVFEDAPSGVTAAISAGMQVVMMPDENVPVELQKGAHLVINSLEQTPLDLFGLPPLKI